MLESQDFVTWQGTAKETLFCPGPQGAGKTILTTVVVDHLLTDLRSHDDTIGIAYIYCYYKKKEEQTLINLASSLVQHLVQQRNEISEGVKKCYHSYSQQRNRPKLEEVWQLLYPEMLMFPRIFIMIDALDECGHDDQTRQRLIDRLRSMQEFLPINLMVTSHPIPVVVSDFCDSLSVHIRANETDIRNYVQAQMVRLPPAVQQDPSL